MDAEVVLDSLVVLAFPVQVEVLGLGSLLVVVGIGGDSWLGALVAGAVDVLEVYLLEQAVVSGEEERTTRRVWITLAGRCPVPVQGRVHHIPGEYVLDLALLQRPVREVHYPVTHQDALQINLVIAIYVIGIYPQGQVGDSLARVRLASQEDVLGLVRGKLAVEEVQQGIQVVLGSIRVIIRVLVVAQGAVAYPWWPINEK